MKARFAIPLLSGLIALAPGCIAYNEQCQGLTDNPEKVIGYTSETIYLDKPNTRHAPNAIGQLAADAFADAFSDSERPVSFAVVNGGAIRAEGLCITRNILKPGEMTNGLLHEILLFENIVKAVDVTESEVIAMMEHSVDRLVAAPGQISSPSGQFLQVSKQVKMEVDCAQPVGRRVTSLQIGSDVLISATVRDPNPTKMFRVALSSFLIGGDGYDMLVGPGSDPARNPAQAQRKGGTDGNITADYMERTYKSSPANGLRLDKERLTIKRDAVGVPTCSAPPPPAG